MLASIYYLFEWRLLLKFIQIFIIFSLFGTVELTDDNLLRIDSAREGQILVQRWETRGPEIILSWPIYNQFPPFPYFLLSFAYQVRQLFTLIVLRWVLLLVMRVSNFENSVLGIIILIKFWFQELRFSFPSFAIRSFSVCHVVGLSPLKTIEKVRLLSFRTHSCWANIFIESPLDTIGDK